MKSSFKKIRKLAITGLVLNTVILTACSSNNGNTTPGSNSDQASNSKPYQLKMALPVLGAVPADLELVEAEMNKIAQAEINTTIDILPISIGAWAQQMNLMASSGEKLDLLYEFGPGYPNDVAAGKILALDELLNKYGQGITKALGEKNLKAASINGKTYGAPYYTAYGSQSVIVMRKDLVEKHNIDINSVKSLEDLGPVFEKIKNNEPGIVPLASGLSTPLDHYRDYDRLGDRVGILTGFDNGLKVENLFETESYKKNIDLMHQWFKAGYINKDAATSKTPVQDLVKSNKAFSYIYSDKPGQLGSQMLQTGKELVSAKLLPYSYSTTSDVLNGLWSIAAQSENPERAMMFLNLLYTNEKLANLFVWGIEGKHYVKVSETQVDYPDGVDKSNVKYGISDYMGGNTSIIYVFKTDAPDLRKQIIEFNQNVTKSKAFGFAYNSEPVKNEITAINAVIEQYKKALDTGTMDPTQKLAEFNIKLKAAGLDKVIAEKQKQLNEWAAANK